MITRSLNRIVAMGVFLAALVVYALTLSPTVVFWDVGEFIAAAKLMQVPHPPGSPLFLLGARLAMMIPYAADQAVRAHFFSAVLSAFGIMFLYLVIVRVIEQFRGFPSTVLDRIIVYGAGVIGALSLAFGTTYWDNSIEAEVYGASMFFLSCIMWLAMRWLDKSDEEGNEKYVLMIAYMIGLSLGVHLLALLAIFPVLMLIYFKRYEVNTTTFFRFAIVAVLAFFIVYPGIVKWLPGMMDGEFKGQKSEIFEYLPWIIVAAVAYGAYWSYGQRQRVLHVALMSMLLIFLGYTTYTSVIIRSNVHPPMNENDPSNLARLTSYLNREQYGDAPLFMPRRYSQEAHQQGIYTNYKSDMDFLWRYQLKHMFFRYFFWNYVGIEGDYQDADWSWKDTWGIPLLVGLIGLWYQFKKDWKMGLIFLGMFIALGPVLALYQNQQEPQPRERDYFYAGAFYVFSLWIAVGVVGIIDTVRKRIASEPLAEGVTFAALVIALLAIPVRMAANNWHEHNRSGNYVAWDYSYNILQTCEKDAILFTNGDNDTFPLWYLQDVEGIRRDVRIVNLSLVNTPWYIQQMKNPPYYQDAKAVPISLSEGQIAAIQPVMWRQRDIDLPVTEEALQKYGVTDTAILAHKKVTFTVRPTFEVGQTKALRIQDRMVLDIVLTNQWKRPLYFAVTCAPDSKVGLDEYLWFHGLAWRLEPRRISREDLGLNPAVLEANLFNEPQGFSAGLLYGYKFRRVNDPGVYFDENTARLMLNYRSAFLRLAMYQANADNNFAKAGVTLDRMEELIPRSKIPMGWELASDLANFYHRIGRKDRFEELSAEVEKQCIALIESGQFNLSSYWNPYRVLLDVYEQRGDDVKALALLQQLEVRYPGDPVLKERVAAVQARLAARVGTKSDSAR